MTRYRISVWHGERKSVFYVIDTFADEIVETFYSRVDAQAYVNRRMGGWEEQNEHR